jgi:hypothetical protein
MTGAGDAGLPVPMEEDEEEPLVSPAPASGVLLEEAGREGQGDLHHVPALIQQLSAMHVKVEVEEDRDTRPHHDQLPAQGDGGRKTAVHASGRAASHEWL